MGGYACLANNGTPPYHCADLDHGALAHFGRLDHRIGLDDDVSSKHCPFAPHGFPHARSTACRSHGGAPAFGIKLSAHAHADFCSFEDDASFVQYDGCQCAAELAVWMQYRVGANCYGMSASDLGMLGDEDR